MQNYSNWIIQICTNGPCKSYFIYTEIYFFFKLIIFQIEIKTQELILKAPALTGTCESKTIIVKKKDIIKVLVNFQKLLPVVFYYVTPSVGQNIRNTLGMIDGSDTFFDPLSTVESFKRITILPDYIGDETKKKFKGIYRTNMEELTTQEANDILIKTCPKELTKVISNAG